MELNPTGALRAELDLASGRVTLSVPMAPAGATCYSIQRLPDAIDFVALKWSAEGVAVESSIIDTIPFPSSGQYCYYLVFGSPSGNSLETSRACVEIPGSVAPAPSPTPTPANFRPPSVGPPAAGMGRAPGEGRAVNAAFLALSGGALLLGLGGLLLRRKSS